MRLGSNTIRELWRDADAPWGNELPPRYAVVVNETPHAFTHGTQIVTNEAGGLEPLIVNWIKVRTGDILVLDFDNSGINDHGLFVTGTVWPTYEAAIVAYSMNYDNPPFV